MGRAYLRITVHVNKQLTVLWAVSAESLLLLCLFIRSEVPLGESLTEESINSGRYDPCVYSDSRERRSPPRSEGRVTAAPFQQIGYKPTHSKNAWVIQTCESALSRWLDLLVPSLCHG